MTRDALFAERMRVVLAIGEANAAHHRAQARAGGAQILSMQAARDGEAGAGEVAAQAALAVAAAKVTALEAELAVVDRALAAAAP